MKKVLIDRAGGYDRLRIVEGPALVPGAGEVRVDVAYAGVNYADCVVRMGLYASAKQYVGWPITPGFEVAGAVGAVGAGVDPGWLGREVFAVTRFGGYASEVVVPLAQVFARPPALSLAEAAAFPAVHSNRCTSPRSRRGDAESPRWPDAWTPSRHSVVVCSSVERGGGTVTCPRGRASSLASSRPRVSAQYRGASSRYRARGQYGMTRMTSAR